MQRVAVYLTMSLAGALPVSAGPALTAPLFPPDATPAIGPAGRSIDLSAYSAFRGAASIHQQYEPFVSRVAEDAVPTANGGLAQGPMQSEYMRRSRKRAHFATFRLDGVSVFGGAIGGSIDGRSANVMLSWPMSP